MPGPGRYDNVTGYPPHHQQPPQHHYVDTTANSTSIGRRPTTLGRAPTRRIIAGANSNVNNASQDIQRGRTLIRPDRYQEPAPLMTGKPQTSRSAFEPWTLLSRIVTFWALPPMLKACGLHDKGMQQAWREKITLCFLIACLGGFVAFITIGLSTVLCPPGSSNNAAIFASYNDTSGAFGLVGIQGWQFNISTYKPTGSSTNFYDLLPGTDVTNNFLHGQNLEACTNPGDSTTASFAAVTLNPCTGGNCALGPLNDATFKTLSIFNSTRQVGFDWQQMASPNLTNFLVVDGNVLNMDPYMNTHKTALANDELDSVIRTVLNQTFAMGGRDATKLMYRTSALQAAVPCLVQKYRAGAIDKDTPGCFMAAIILYCSLLIVVSLVLARFLMALIFSWFLSRRLSQTPQDVNSPLYNNAAGAISVGAAAGRGGKMFPNQQSMEMADINTPLTGGYGNTRVEIGNDLYTVMLITCYSENTEGIRATVESLSSTIYPDDRKLLFLVADGIITGHGETMSTPDMCLDLVTFDNPAMKNPEAKAYLAVATGSKQYNMAKVYAGHYVCKGHKVPLILIVKCGGPAEQGKPKPGNRGKRDSQLILMNFFSRVTYNDRMTPLDYELFQKIKYITGVTPDLFEVVLMVDADTKVYDTSLRVLVNCMVNDNLIMGLCGETKIANKRDSWVTAIQVYEYFISHHMAKGFEAVFGGVTCLPGCFSMYRLKARKGDGDWIPIITKPEIVQEYSSNTIDTLHQKNLLLLGEDRFLTTLMLRNFPFRKMVFTPQAICKTIVPDEFKVLLSQRRRWINSTIHNLFELVLVRNLCGTFCFSMQFVVMMDLVGTLTLPVAIILTVVLIINMARTKITDFSTAVPLILLIIVLFSPAFLILITTRKWVYLMWMGVYLLALPVWNFVLPVYSFWHFDDFSWGETRKVEGETKGDDHSKAEGQFDPSKVPLKRWEDYERKRIRANKRRERKERQIREMGPTHLTHEGGIDDDRRGLLDDDNQSDVSGGPMHYFDPSKEAPVKSGSGYYPSFTPQSSPATPPKQQQWQQPPPSHQPQFMGPGQYMGTPPTRRQ
ncbi:chitin synthase-domain-containing protein [Halteromyces radiatus]|uniref:chitin synthase-domain-containing protein n=1 Tax=Halteromyces radiatus TaxID=101107 RepID=UPI00221E4B8C|nr:chitin synthase-domain-containing protein [Halteromyces radiatus]KAI8084786.1 chitin synthase-domain-containing protein [Halteromyces radiatus]